MSTILQDMMGMLSRKKVKKVKLDDYFIISRYETPHERLKPNPKVDTELILAKDLVSFVNNNISKLFTIEPFNLLAGAGGSSTMPTNYNLIDISWDGLGSGNYTLNLPSASLLTHRNIRIITDGSLDNGARDKIFLTPASGDTIDGGANFELSKRYESVSIWSDGTEWIVIQAKAH
tara:strand:+ start:1824 stop:2351 length:528 start_codon:yes stop_codon:yes gene_type:complete